MSNRECRVFQFTVPDRNYFRQVTRLAFDIDLNPPWPVDALERLSAWIDLAQLHELWILEMSPCELRFEAIKYLLEQASQVRIFGINYNEWPWRIAGLGSILSGRIDHFKVRGADLQCVKTTLKHMRSVPTITFEQLSSDSSVLTSIIEYLTKTQRKFTLDYRVASIQIQGGSLEMKRGQKRRRTMNSSTGHFCRRKTGGFL